MYEQDLGALAKREVDADLVALMKAAQTPGQLEMDRLGKVSSVPLGEQLRHALKPAAGDVIPFRKAQPSGPVSPPPRGPRPGSGMPLAAYKSAWGDALAKRGLRRKL